MLFIRLYEDEIAQASYLIGCQDTREAVVVDPSRDVGRYLRAAEDERLRITHVVETHIHADFLSGSRELAERTGASLRMGAGAPVGFDFAPLSEDDVIDVGNRHIRVIETPGHTPEHVSLLVDDWFVLTGDTLFVGDVGRVDLALEEVLQEDLAAARPERALQQVPLRSTAGNDFDQFGRGSVGSPATAWSCALCT